MELVNWYLKVIKNYATFSGRARRKEYWMFTLVNIIVSIILSVIDTIVFGNNAMVFLGIYALIMFIPSLAVAVRRLHDTNRSGWWILVSLIPLLGGIAFFVFMVLDEKSDDNKYGPSPKLEL